MNSSSGNESPAVQLRQVEQQVMSVSQTSQILRYKLEDAIRMHVRRVYEKYGQNLTRAAEALDVSRNTVRKYL